MMRFLDAGTTYAKILEGDDLRILRTEALPSDFRADAATGHNAARWSPVVVNELIALARGGAARIAEKDFVLMDVGARDMKVVQIEGGALHSCDWNDSCGALCGFGVELLGRHFALDWSGIEVAPEGLHITCGIFGLSELFDRIALGMPIPRVVAMFLRGLAELAHRFAGRPNRLYLSGGMCENPLFLGSLDVEVIPLGRGVLVEGLRALKK
ncbi:MAG: ATPase [Planctomycetota bacterium]|jgi:activator of 2-hydroxyglutaryl-CoA dehydratase